jgi:pimeloyl-ACP methyl ester carboxylesterase
MTARPTVFLLPGLMCDEAIWEHQRQALAPHADVHIPVFRGFSSLRVMAEAVLEHAPARFSVVGHSMGGRVAFELMEIAGKRIERFAVMDTGVHGVQVGEAAKRGILLAAAERQGLQAVADAWILPMLHPDNHTNQVLIESINRMILRNSLDDYRGQVGALLARADQTPYLARIQQKTWLLCGEADSWSPVSQHEAMQQHLAASELRIIKNAGHMSPMEQPDAVSNILVEWINE